MTVVLVHGNPETPEVLDLLVDRLVDDGAGQPVRLAPPGFGAPVPIDFSCGPAAYRDWLIEELEAIPGPIDLVGHDWGGVHVVTAVISRSWADRSMQRWPLPAWQSSRTVMRLSAPRLSAAPPPTGQEPPWDAWTRVTGG